MPRPTLLALALLAAAPLAPLHAQFQPNRHLYSETASPAADIAAAQRLALQQHKHILLDFGANWCGDCQVLDLLYNQQPNAALVAAKYIVVHIDVGHIDRNLDIAHRYHVPIDHGIPSLGILDAHGKVLYAEQPKEFEHTTPEALHTLLTRYQPTR